MKPKRRNDTKLFLQSKYRGLQFQNKKLLEKLGETFRVEKNQMSENLRSNANRYQIQERFLQNVQKRARSGAIFRVHEER